MAYEADGARWRGGGHGFGSASASTSSTTPGTATHLHSGDSGTAAAAGVGWAAWLQEEIGRDYEPGLDDSYPAFGQGAARTAKFLSVPWEVERLLGYGVMICLDCFLFLWTFLPLRAFWALLRLVTLQGLGRSGSCDLLHLALAVVSAYGLACVDVSYLYHNIRGQSVMKLYVVFNLLDLVDKLCSSFGQDILESLYLYVVRADGSWDLRHLVPHLSLSMGYVWLHGMVILYQCVTLNVAMNSHNNLLLTIMISNQFVELKSSVFKRHDERTLMQIVCSDIRERFQLTVIVIIVALRNMSAHNWSEVYFYGPLLNDVALVLGTELVVDSLKHGFVTRFNSIDVSVYRNHRQVLYADVTENGRRKGHRLLMRLGFNPLPLSCLVFCILRTVFPQLRGFQALYYLLCAMALLMPVKFLTGALILYIARNREHSPAADFLVQSVSGPLERLSKMPRDKIA